MRNDTGLTEAGQHYAAAYAAHYTTKDLHEAIELYKGVMAAYPNTQEAKGPRKNNFTFWAPGLRQIRSRRPSESAGVLYDTLRISRPRSGRIWREPGRRKPEVVFARTLRSRCTCDRAVTRAHGDESTG